MQCAPMLAKITTSIVHSIRQVVVVAAPRNDRSVLIAHPEACPNDEDINGRRVSNTMTLPEPWRITVHRLFERFTPPQQLGHA